MKNPFEHGYYDEIELRSFGFKSVGHNVRIAKNCTIIGLQNISIENNVRIDGHVTIIASMTNPFHLESHIHIGSYSHICGSAGFIMRDFSALSAGVRIFTRSDDFSGEFMTNPTVPAKYTNVTDGEIIIGRHSIVGTTSVVLPGVSIGDGCSIGALSLVHKSLEAWGAYFGSPVKRIGNRSQKVLEVEQQFLKAG